MISRLLTAFREHRAFTRAYREALARVEPPSRMDRLDRAR